MNPLMFLPTDRLPANFSINVVADNAASPQVSRTCSNDQQTPALSPYSKNRRSNNHRRRKSSASRWAEQSNANADAATAAAVAPIIPRRPELVKEEPAADNSAEKRCDSTPRMPSRRRLSVEFNLNLVIPAQA